VPAGEKLYAIAPPEWLAIDNEERRAEHALGDRLLVLANEPIFDEDVLECRVSGLPVEAHLCGCFNGDLRISRAMAAQPVSAVGDLGKCDGSQRVLLLDPAPRRRAN